MVRDTALDAGLRMRARYPTRTLLFGALLGALFGGCGGTPSGPDDGPPAPQPDPLIRLQPPVDGTPNVSVFYGWLVDDAPGPGFLDYQCGDKGVDGHQGTDILIPNFGAMDDGVAVVAAAAGTVTFARDGLPDRNTALLENNGPGNWIELGHGGGFATRYFHLRRGSLAVTEGDVVEAGQTIGLVGSSGRSNWPHLHFELRTGSAAQEPWAGECGAARSFWIEQLPYQDEFRLIDGGLTDLDSPTYARLLERPDDVTTVTAGQDHLVFWVSLHNPPGALARFQLVDPHGDVAQEIAHQAAAVPSVTILAATFPVAGVLETTGSWQARYLHGSSQVASIPFELVEPPVAAVAQRRPAAPEIRVYGGGPVDGF